MPLPTFTSEGELPAGLHAATMVEVIARFGCGTPQRQAVTARLLRISDLGNATGKLDRIVIFDSYLTTAPAPNDVDLLLILANDFRAHACSEETRGLFDHNRATTQFGASIFWLRPAMLLTDTLEEFIAHW